jgi:Family of unknown function (DUF6523)
MDKPTGFGKELPQEQKAKINKEKRKEAHDKYEEMKKSGMPVFNIFVRLTDDPRWLPAGSLAVERSSQIDGAIFQQEEELKKGALRLYPKLNKFGDRFEYGYQMREFADEEIKLAVRPIPGFAQKLGALVRQIKIKLGMKP